MALRAVAPTAAANENLNNEAQRPTRVRARGRPLSDARALHLRSDHMESMEAHEAVARLLRACSQRVDVCGVVRAMREHPAAARVQEQSLEALLRLLPDACAGEQSAEAQAAVRTGALQAAVAALRAHVADADVQLLGVTLCNDLGLECPAEAAAAVAVEAAVAAMEAHPAHAGVQEECCSLLRCLAKETASLDDDEETAGGGAAAPARSRSSRAGQARAVAAVLAALRTHGALLHAPGFGALALLLAPSRANGRHALRAGGVELCVAALRAPPRMAPLELAAAASSLLSIVCASFAAASARAGALGAVEALVAVLRAHPREQLLQFTACALLCMLLSNHGANVARAARAGALPLAQAAGRSVTDHRGAGDTFSSMGRNVARIEAHLLEFEAGARAAADAAAAELLAEEEAERRGAAHAAAAAAAAAPSRKSKKKRNKKKLAKDGQPAAGGSAAPASPAAEEEEEEVPAAPALAEAEQRPMCAICLDALPCVVLLPCRHVPLCAAPACAAMLGAPPLCPLCRVAVADTLQVYPL
jgi:hypothetical protein